MRTVLFRTAPGLEDLVRNEALIRLKAETDGQSGLKGRRGKGWLELVLPEGTVPDESFAGFHTAFRGIEVKGRRRRGTEVAALEAEQCARKAGFRELKSRPPFRISCYADAEPSGTVRSVEQRVGAAAVEESRAPVSLTEWEINYGVEFIDGEIFFGPLFLDEEQTPRYRKQFQVRSSLKPHVAAAMLNLSGFQGRPGTVLDPCCGSGTILLEAASLHPGVRCYGTDIDPRCAEGAQKNLSALARADSGSRIWEGDARELSALFPAGGIDYLITNPPFGIRTGKKLNFYWFYFRLLQGADRLLTDRGRIAILIGRKRGIFNKAVEDEGHFTNLHVRVVDTSGLFPALFILGRKGKQ